MLLQRRNTAKWCFPVIIVFRFQYQYKMSEYGKNLDKTERFHKLRLTIRDFNILQVEFQLRLNNIPFDTLSQLISDIHIPRGIWEICWRRKETHRTDRSNPTKFYLMLIKRSPTFRAKYHWAWNIWFFANVIQIGQWLHRAGDDGVVVVALISRYNHYGWSLRWENEFLHNFFDGELVLACLHTRNSNRYQLSQATLGWRSNR